MEPWMIWSLMAGVTTAIVVVALVTSMSRKKKS